MAKFHVRKECLNNVQTASAWMSALSVWPETSPCLSQYEFVDELQSEFGNHVIRPQIVEI